MINFKAVIRSIMARKRVDADTAWSAVSEAWLRLDQTRQESEQAAYLLKVGCFFTCEHKVTDEVAIDELAEIIPDNRKDFDEEAFMRALSGDAREVAESVLNGGVKILTVDSVRWQLKNNNRPYSRKRAKEIINELSKRNRP